MKNAEIRSLAASEIAERIVAEQENLSKLKFAVAAPALAVALRRMS